MGIKNMSLREIVRHRLNDENWISNKNKHSVTNNTKTEPLLLSNSEETTSADPTAYVQAESGRIMPISQRVRLLSAHANVYRGKFCHSNDYQWLNTRTYANHLRNSRWTFEDTIRFYKALE